MTDEMIDFREFFVVLWKRKYWIAGAALAGGLVGLGLAIKAVPFYKATSKLVCKTSGSANPDIAGLAALAGLKMGGGKQSDPSAYFNDVIEDDDFLGRLLARKWPYKSDSSSMEAVWGIQPDSSKPDWVYRWKMKRVERLRKGKYIDLERRTDGLLILSTVFEDPALAVSVNRYVIAQLNDYVIHSLVTQAKENRKFIEEQIQGIQSALSRSEDALVRFRQRNMNVQAPDLLAEEARLRRDVTMNQEIYVEMRKQLELARIDERKDQPLIEVISQPVLPVDKFKPNKRRMVLLGVVAGFLAGILAAFAAHWIRGVGEWSRRPPAR